MFFFSDEFELINRKLDWLISAVRNLGAKQMADFSKLQDQVTAQTTVVTSVQTLLKGLSDQIIALKSTVSDPAAQAAIDALAAQVAANSKTLTDAVTANTSAVDAAGTPATPPA